MKAMRSAVLSVIWLSAVLSVMWLLPMLAAFYLFITNHVLAGIVASALAVVPTFAYCLWQEIANRYGKDFVKSIREKER